MKVSTRTVLQADEGMVLTDGKVYGRLVMLAEDRSAEEFYEITEAEYDTIMSEGEEDILTDAAPAVEEQGKVPENATSEADMEVEANGS